MGTRGLRIAGALVLIVGLACSPGGDADPPPQFTLGAITDPDDDGPWRGAAESLADLAARRGGRMLTATAGDTSSVRAAVRRLGPECDFVVCVGEACAAVLLVEAVRWPGTAFVTVPAVRPGDNLAAIELRGAGAGYLAGLVAAELVESRGSVGVLGDAFDDFGSSVAAGFEAGAADFSNGRVDIQWSSATGPSGEFDAVLCLPGCDPEQAGALGGPVILVDGTRSDLQRAQVAAVVTVDRAGALRAVAVSALEGSFEGNSHVFGLREGTVEVLLHPERPELATAEFRERLDRARDAVLAGFVAIESFGL